jgi:hypothetical protein
MTDERKRAVDALAAYAADPESDILTVFRVERAYEVDTQDIDREWMP